MRKKREEEGEGIRRERMEKERGRKERWRKRGGRKWFSPRESHSLL